MSIGFWLLVNFTLKPGIPYRYDRLPDRRNPEVIRDTAKTSYLSWGGYID